ncbi:MAG: 1-deoxy-D-xylulose-5-phosphate reductoisomerase [Candidatus Aminicenantes bacterium]|nr:1-deoxy-D-xylulose-5-phosphate reductoisomerase [Candidatus Aminicenantes bacterium]
MKKINIAVLGSTGSIGRSTLEIVDLLSHRFKVIGLAAGRNSELLSSQMKKFKPEIVSLEKESDANNLRAQFFDDSIQVLYGQEGAEEIARYKDVDIIVAAITGINGLRSTIAAVKSGKKVALANKESMVVAGSLIQKMAKKSGAQIFPVDSEHSGVFQCLAKEDKINVKRVILTASGGPFFQSTKEEMDNSTIEDALNHPRWKMGEKVTIDSATMMNKGLELIEARWLFDIQPEQLDVLIHPQSIVHSLVELRDGSMIAQLSQTDMKIPIQYALTYPEREESPLPPLDLSQIKALEFYDVDKEKFPMLELARQALNEGDSAPVTLNAANEVAVKAFLERKISFSDIYLIISTIMRNHKTKHVDNLEDIFSVDRETKLKTRNLLEQRL